jgi:hypothetical protein
MKERWVPIPGYEGYYEASTKGRVRSLNCGKIRLMNPYVEATGYLATTLSKKSIKKHALIHRLIASAFHGANPKRHVHHKNNKKTDNRPENLEWVSKAENARKAHKDGLITYGLNNVISDREVEAIRALAKLERLSGREIADCFGISQSHTNSIIRGDRR